MKSITKNLVLLIPMVLIILGFVYSITYNNFIEDAIIETGIKYQKIYHIEKINKKAIVFYKDDKGLSEGYIQKTLFGWKWVTGGGRVNLQSSKEIEWHYSSNNKDLPIFYGVINNPEIISVKLKELETGNLDKTAKIVDIEGNLRLWFLFSPKRIEDYSFMIIGVTSNGKEIFYH